MTVIPSLATPRDCLLAVAIGAGSEISSDDNYAALTSLAGDFRVPVIYVHADPSSASNTAFSNSEATLQTSTLADPFADACVEQAISDHKRSKLILAGLSSEGTVTFMALGALARGFDVYVVEDQCQSSCDRAHTVAMQRLAQAGAVLTTALQLHTEWSASSEQIALAQRSVM